MPVRMSIATHNQFGERPISAADQGHIWRSRLLDAFADLESNVIKLLAKGKGPFLPASAPLGQKIEALKELDMNQPLPKNCKPKLAAICAEIMPMLEVRANIVHAKLVMCDGDGIQYAKFCNTMNCDKPYPEIRMLSGDDFDAFNKSIHRMSNQLRQILNPPSSPPQPSPDAASGL